MRIIEDLKNIKIQEIWRKKPMMVHTSAVASYDHRHQALAIERYHKGLGWKNCGYSYIIERDGTLYESEALYGQQYHCKHGGQNRLSLGICLSGDGTKQYPTDLQITVLQCLLETYETSQVIYHCDFNKNKSCPGSYIIAALENYPQIPVIRY